MSVAKFLKTDGLGNVSLLKEHTHWRDTWQILLPVQFQGTITGLFVYDRFLGEAKFLTTDANGDVTLLKEHGGLNRSWDIIVRGNFGGPSTSTPDLLFYRRDAGEAKFLTTDANGDVTLLKDHTDWNTIWDIIVPGNFSSGYRTDLLLYEQDMGVAKFYATDGSGNITKLSEHTWQPGWDIIVPGNFGGSSYTDLLFYRRSDGLAKFYATDGSGNITKLSEHTWQPGWDIIVPGNFGGSSYTDLLLYASGLNRAATIGWRGCVDTDLSFSDFFDSDHTVMARFMLQYPQSYAGPICAENGSGTYFLGQGYFSKRATGDRARLRFQVGKSVRTVSISEASAGTWQHVAIVRKGNRFDIFLNGVLRTNLTISASEPDLPTSGSGSTLRLGRRTEGKNVGTDGVLNPESSRESQFYGMVDDVAVFSKALTQTDIAAIVNAPSKRLTGTEPGLLAGWTFEPSTPSGDRLPDSLNRPVSFLSLPGAAGRAAAVVTLSPARDDGYDSTLLPRPGLRVIVPLPFAQDEVWRVVSPNSASVTPGDGASHWGYPVFALDLDQAPASSCEGKIRAVADGTVVQVVDNTTDGGNNIVVEHAPDLLCQYLHHAEGTSQVKVGDKVIAGQYLADIGNPKCHLHLSMRNLKNPDPASGGEDAVSIPFAFEHFDVCTPASPEAERCTTWTHAKHTLPLNDEWIRWG